MRILGPAAVLLALALGGCMAPDRWRPESLASVPALSFEPSTGVHLTDDLAMGIDGAMLLPSPDGGAPIEVPRDHPVATDAGLQVSPPLLLGNPARALPGLASVLWERQAPTAPYRSGIELYRKHQLKLMIGTRTLIDEHYPDSVTTDPRHDPQDSDTAAVFGLRFGF